MTKSVFFVPALCILAVALPSQAAPRKKENRSPNNTCISRTEAIKKAANVLELDAGRGRAIAKEIAQRIVFDEKGQLFVRKAGEVDENVNNYVLVHCDGTAYLVVDRGE